METHLAFFEYVKAFDKVKRDKLFEILQRKNIAVHEYCSAQIFQYTNIAVHKYSQFIIKYNRNLLKKQN